jgi:hypothetical protein
LLFGPFLDAASIFSHVRKGRKGLAEKGSDDFFFANPLRPLRRCGDLFAALASNANL